MFAQIWAALFHTASGTRHAVARLVLRYSALGRTIALWVHSIFLFVKLSAPLEELGAPT